MTTYRLIGKGTTDSNGVAHMDYSTSDGGSTWTDISSNPGYTGVGAGEIDLVASTDSTIGSGSLVSETYELWDYIKYDNGNDSTHNIWGTIPSDTTLDYDSGEYADWKKTSTSNKYLSTTFTGVSDICFEFDFYQATGGRNSRFIQISDSNSSAIYYATLQDILMYAQTWNHIKIEFRSGKIYVNDVDISQTYSTTPAMLSLVLWGSSMTEVYFKNLKIYPI